MTQEQVVDKLLTEGIVYDEAENNEMEDENPYVQGEEYVNDFRIANAYDETIAAYDNKEFVPREPEPRKHPKPDLTQFHPPAFDIPEGVPAPGTAWQGHEDLNQLVVSWYNAGYYTGYYLGMQAAKRDQGL